MSSPAKAPQAAPASSTIATVRAPVVAGGDVVELNPLLDPTGITAVVAAKLARELLARMIAESASSRAGNISRRSPSAVARRSRGKTRRSGSS